MNTPHNTHTHTRNTNQAHSTSRSNHANSNTPNQPNTSVLYENVSPESNDIYMIYQTLKQQRENLATLTDTIRYNGGMLNVEMLKCTVCEIDMYLH